MTARSLFGWNNVFYFRFLFLRLIRRSHLVSIFVSSFPYKSLGQETKWKQGDIFFIIRSESRKHFFFQTKQLLSFFLVFPASLLIYGYVSIYWRAWRRIDLDLCVKSMRYVSSCECTFIEVFIVHETHLLMFELIKFQTVLDY